MLYNSNNPAGQDHRVSSGGSTGGAGPGAGAGAATGTTTKDICSSKAQFELVERQNLDNSSGYVRQISLDSGNASDCLDSGTRIEISGATSRAYSPTTNIDLSRTCPGETTSREMTMNKYDEPSQTTTTTTTRMSTSGSQQSFARKRIDPGYPSHTEINYHQQQQTVHNAGQKRWAASSVQSFSEIPVVATSQGCCLAQATEASCCSNQSQSISGQQGDDQPDEDDYYEPEEESEQSLDYKPILAKILNEKKLALISTPEVITFLSSGKQGAPPTAHKRTNM